MRCPTCNKFVSFDEDQDPEEVGDADFDAEVGHLVASYRRVLACAECGGELLETEVEFDEAIDLPPDGCKTGEGDAPAAHEWELDHVEASALSERRKKKTFYGVDMLAVFVCSRCSTQHDHEACLAPVAASEMDEV